MHKSPLLPLRLLFLAVATLSTARSRAQTPTVTTVARLGGDPNGFYPRAAPVQGPDGNFYGTTEAGGPPNCGTIYQLTAAGTLTTIYVFTGGADGANPLSALVAGSDGNLYGTTSSGGSGGSGTVFRVTTAGALTTLHGFSATTYLGNSDGAYPYAALIQGSDGNFYGTTYQGGANDGGTAFEITPGGTLTTIYNFGSVYNADGSDGYFITTGLAQGADGNFYGTTNDGGSGFDGSVFRLTPAGVLTTLYSFTGDDGGAPGTLAVGADGNFYGLTPTGGTPVGGATIKGTAFMVTPAGVFTTLHGFDAAVDGTPQEDSSYPPGLVRGSDNNFYGTNTSGGANDGGGTVFELTPAGVVTVLYTFPANAGSATAPYGGYLNGANPVGVCRTADGTLYGATVSGGSAYNDAEEDPSGGTVFQLTPAGVQTVDFRFTQGGSEGQGGLLQGSDDNLYGATLRGGTLGQGTLFSMSLAGAVTTLHSFNDDTDGSYPAGSLLQDSSGTLYGATASGSAGGAGAFFSLSAPYTSPTSENYVGYLPGDSSDSARPADTGSGFLKGLAAFLLPPEYIKGGIRRQATVINEDKAKQVTAATPAAVGDASLVFYGTAFHGGNGGVGGIYSVTGAGTFSTLYAFAGAPTDGANPQQGLVSNATGTIFYGTTEYGGANGQGTVFSYAPATGTESVLYSFAGTTDGANPYASLMFGSDGNLYGTTSAASYDPDTGQQTGAGTVFRVTPAGALTTLYTFADNGLPGSGPKAALLQASDGNFYGTTATTVFSMTPGGTLTTLGNIHDGSDSPLIEASDGNLYGLSIGGGTEDAGVVFRVALAGSHPSFFTGEAALSNGVYYLAFPNGNYFGYYSFLSNPDYIYHFDLGYEYVFDAQDGKAGVYFYDFASRTFFYTSPTFPFPYLYDFTLNTVLYYYPDPNNPGHYNTNGYRFFFDFNTGTIITR